MEGGIPNWQPANMELTDLQSQEPGCISPKVIMSIYMTLIRPILTCGAIVWWPKTTTTQLNLFQKTACLLATGALKSTPINVMEVLLRLTALDIHIKEVPLMTMTLLRTIGIEPTAGKGIHRPRLWKRSLDVRFLTAGKYGHQDSVLTNSRGY